MIKVITLLGALIILSACVAEQQRMVLIKCLEQCNGNDAACINACGNLLKGECK